MVELSHLDVDVDFDAAVADDVAVFYGDVAVFLVIVHGSVLKSN